MTGLEVTRVGLTATLQDPGRFGYYRYGIAQGGAVDGFAYRLGQRLVGQARGGTAIEIALGQLCCRALGPLCVAVTGAANQVTINGEGVPSQMTLYLKADDEITVAAPSSGTYSYLAFAGTPALEPVLGSYSTVLREGLGGFAGRSLARGDQLEIIAAELPPQRRWPMPPPSGNAPLTLRFIPGFQMGDADPGVSRQLESGTYQVTEQRNRMGIRIEGAPLHTGIEQLWSEATCLGAIQVPPDGQPIVLLNDRQTVGGYPKLGAVLSPDCARLAQRSGGTRVRFKPVSPEEADRILWLHANYEREMVLQNVARSG